MTARGGKSTVLLLLQFAGLCSKVFPEEGLSSRFSGIPGNYFDPSLRAILLYPREYRLDPGC
jgi:hypothetical protein